jgi:hypothetical protein
LYCGKDFAHYISIFIIHNNSLLSSVTLQRQFIGSLGLGGNMDDGEKAFNDYLLEEYKNIAEAHFKTIETITEFYKHYFTIVSIPISIFAIAINFDGVKDILQTLTSSG